MCVPPCRMHPSTSASLVSHRVTFRTNPSREWSAPPSQPSPLWWPTSFVFLRYSLSRLYTLNFLYYWELKQYVERVQGCQGRKLYLVTVSFHLLATCHAQPALLQHLLISIQQTIFCPAPPRLSTCSISSWQYGSCELSSVYRSLSDGESGDDGFKGSFSVSLSVVIIIGAVAKCRHQQPSAHTHSLEISWTINSRDRDTFQLARQATWCIFDCR